jgi:hypothetical protein
MPPLSALRDPGDSWRTAASRSPRQLSPRRRSPRQQAKHELDQFFAQERLAGAPGTATTINDGQYINTIAQYSQQKQQMYTYMGILSWE